MKEKRNENDMELNSSKLIEGRFTFEII